MVEIKEKRNYGGSKQKRKKLLTFNLVLCVHNKHNDSHATYKTFVHALTIDFEYILLTLFIRLYSNKNK